MDSEIVSHYRIIRKLGEGGMGEVFLAEDIRLGREVALKFLPSSYQYDPDRSARFLKEARAASSLRSPNIAHIYDIGEHRGTRFIAMEYVEGDVLARRLERGTLSVRETIDVAAQIADALEEAHSQGIVHRDIKSSNLIINDRGLVKVLDFGLAKITETARGDEDEEHTITIGQKTSAGVVIGTVSYMSPEQALGGDVDFRSDIFSLGVVMYEMLTGRMPFDASSFTGIIDRIVHDEPTAIARLNYDVPPELEQIVRKCMEKECERRYQSARELLTDLRNLQRDCDTGQLVTSNLTRRLPSSRKGRSRKQVNSLAILPFANASDDPDMEYLSDGITESIINNLSQLPKLKVMARSTVFRYKGKPADPQEVGEALGVRVVLTGRVLERGDQLIIKAELVDASDGSQIWGEQYNRNRSAIFAVEEEISKEISEKLRLKLSGTEKRQLGKRYTEKTAAYHLYLKGRYSWNKRTVEGLNRGIEYFEQAITEDPNYALAYAGLADSYNILASYSALPSRDAFTRAKTAALKALELDDELAEAHTSLALIRFGCDWNWREAEREYELAIKLNPGYATAHLWYALYLAAMGRFDEAFREIKRAQELDPLSLPINTNAGWIMHLARRYDEAIEQYRKTLELDPGFILAHRRLGQTYKQKGMYDEAIEELQIALALSGDDTETVAALGHAYAKSGRELGAVKVLEALKQLSKERYIPAYFIARIHIGLGEKDRAFEWLEKTCEERYGFLVYLKVDPVFDPLREDARFADLMRRVGLPE
ncbi:MAG: protein kinase [Blastocatellia bacterium]|nr:protein kinase [Blastocatellia bacterium]